jgi:hypothetical protein
MPQLSHTKCRRTGTCVDLAAHFVHFQLVFKEGSSELIDKMKYLLKTIEVINNKII